MLYRGTKVALAGAFMNFSLGLFYAWSVFAEGLIQEYGWTRAEAVFPYTLQLFVFSIAMIFAGRFQDRVGPRLAVTICGLASGITLTACGFVAHPVGLTLLFGVLFGTASAFGYASATPTALKWFPPEKRGLITGIVLMPMGAAALVWSPLLKTLIGKVGLRGTFVSCGLFLFVAIILASRAMEIPHQENGLPQPAGAAEPVGRIDWRRLLCNPVFVLLWLMLGLTTGTGNMFAGQLVQVAALNFKIPWGYLLVALFALASTLGRLIGGLLCDRFGYLRNIRVALLLLGGAMPLFLSGRGAPALVAATLFLGAGYGSLFTSFPTATGNLFGLGDFGLIYGILFTAVGIAGFAGPLAAALADRSGCYDGAFLIGLAAALLCFLLSVLLQRFTGASPEPGDRAEGA